MPLLCLRRIIIHYRDGISLIGIVAECYGEITCKVLPVGMSYCDICLLFFFFNGWKGALSGDKSGLVYVEFHACLVLAVGAELLNTLSSLSFTS